LALWHPAVPVALRQSRILRAMRKESLSGAFVISKVDWGYSFPCLTIEGLEQEYGPF
jgi:hypothetical protein